MLKDSLILSQRSLEKWAIDLNVEHKKAVGKWDYDKIRTQHENYTSEEFEYIEHDTLSGIECIYATMKMLHKHVYSIPLTATGIPREEVRKRGASKYAKNKFMKCVPTFEQYKELLEVYHGGYTHANRHLVNWMHGSTKEPVIAFDFTSSYPFVLLTEKYPVGQFNATRDCSIDEILQDDNYAYMFRLCLFNVRLKNDDVAMPMLQASKLITSVNTVSDNGRILCADYVEIYMNEIDLAIFKSQYIYDKHLCTDVFYAYKQYLPRWFTDYVFECFEGKTTEKGGDPVLYALLKAKLNSLYGMCCQKCIRDELIEDYITGEYITNTKFTEEEYQKYVDNRNSIFPYQWGCWCTSYAMKNLHELGACAGDWIYSDTDSCYGMNWNLKEVSLYNQRAKAKLRANGYGAVMYNSKAYWLGEATVDGIYCEFIVQGAKRYAVRKTKNKISTIEEIEKFLSNNEELEPGELKITVAGVPKRGYTELKDDINNFKAGLIFRGSVTGKNTHIIFTSEIKKVNNIEMADSIDLSPCDYLLDSINVYDWEQIFYEQYEEKEYDLTKLEEYV